METTNGSKGGVAQVGLGQRPGVEEAFLSERQAGASRAGSHMGADYELVRFVGRFGAVSINHVMEVLGVRRSMAYRRVAACVDRGILERLDLVRAEPTLLRATRSGLRYAALGLEPAIVSPGSIHHWLACASTALLLAEEVGLDQVVSDRELRLFERIEGKPLASAKVSEHPDGSPALHRPDLAILGEERPIAAEVELTPKAPQRLVRLIRAWRRAGWVEEVRYYCAPGPARRAVERAIRAARAEERVRVLEVVAG
jgi:hypothetical protein